MNWRACLFALTVGTLCISCGDRIPGTAVRADSDKHPANNPRHDTGVHNVTMPAGTVLRVRIDDVLSTGKSSIGDSFAGTLIEPVVMNGEDVLPAGIRFKGHVTASEKSNRSKGRAVLGITLDCYELRGSQHSVTASLDAQTSDALKKQNIELIGGGVGLETLICAVAGGRGGVTVAAGTVFSYSLKYPVPL
jgi:hypothetical protein